MAHLWSQLISLSNPDCWSIFATAEIWLPHRSVFSTAEIHSNPCLILYNCSRLPSNRCSDRCRIRPFILMITHSNHSLLNSFKSQTWARMETIEYGGVDPQSFKSPQISCTVKNLLKSAETLSIERVMLSHVML